MSIYTDMSTILTYFFYQIGLFSYKLIVRTSPRYDVRISLTFIGKFSGHEPYQFLEILSMKITWVLVIRFCSKSGHELDWLLGFPVWKTQPITDFRTLEHDADRFMENSSSLFVRGFLPNIGWVFQILVWLMIWEIKISGKYLDEFSRICQWGLTLTNKII